MQRSLRRIKHRIKRLVPPYVSPLGWAVTGLAIASLIAFTILSWHELLTMAIVFACMMVAAIMLSLGNTSFTATIDVSSRRVTVSDTVKVDVCVDNPGRTPTTSARGDLPIGDSHERFSIPMLAAGQSRQTTVEFTAVPRGTAGRPPVHTQRRPIRTRTTRKETCRPNQRVHPPENRYAEHTQRRNSARSRRPAKRRNRRRRPRFLRTA